MKILVHGFPHSGTSILKSIIGQNVNVVEFPYETKIMPKGFNLIKWPYSPDSFFSQEYKSFFKVFIIRNPYFVISSMNRRYDNHFYEKDNPGASVEAWEKVAEKWIKSKNYKKFYVVRYEDLFKGNYIELENIFNFLNLEFEKKIILNKNKEYKIAKGVKLEKERPSPKNHAAFRTWQINQVFKNMNKLNKLTLSTDQYKRISSSKYLEELNYEYLPKKLCVNL